MDDREDPIAQFFPGQDSVDLYAVLSLTRDAKFDDLKKSYRRMALLYHPDKHATASESAKANASLKFQQVGFAYAVLSDGKRRRRYDTTGKTDEGFELDAGEDGWEAYFEDMFDRVTRARLDELKTAYQGSQEEIDDLCKAYIETNGHIDAMMAHIPHSGTADEPRFITIISGMITHGELTVLPAWESSTKDEKARIVRRKQGEKEAAEAEKLAKELGIWDEFYGSGKTGKRRGKGKARDDEVAGDEEDHSALQALILRKKEKNRDNFFDNLAAKYGEPGTKKGKGKKRAKPANEESDAEEIPTKKVKGVQPPDLDDAEFRKLQDKLFGDRATKIPQKA